jgi:predicted transcriptional regulator
MQPRRPTPAELEILGVVWRHGPSTVRGVHEKLNAARPIGYTTVLKLMQIMTEKGLLGRDENARAHVYSARAAESQTQRELVRDLIDRAFGGSAGGLVVEALQGRKTSPEEIARIRRALDSLEGFSRPAPRPGLGATP